MRHPKALHLAHRYQQSTENLPQTNLKEGFLSDPFRHLSSSTQAIQNIFRNNDEIRLRKLQLIKEKDYDIVGRRELKMYNQYKERKKRDMKSNQNDTITTYFSARTSGLSPSPPSYLTKEEVLRLHSPNHKPKQTPDEQYLGEKKPKLWQHSSKTSQLFSPNKTVLLKGNICQKFSLAKLKLKMQQYKKTWQKYTPQNDQHNNSMIILKRQVKTPQSYLEFTLRKHKLSKPKKTWKDQYTQDSLPWNETLRLNEEFQNRGTKEIEKIQVNGLISAGQNKFKKEREWIEQKHNEGFFFQQNKVAKAKKN